MHNYQCVHNCEATRTGSDADLIQPIVEADNRVVVWHSCTHRLHLHQSTARHQQVTTWSRCTSMRMVMTHIHAAQAEGNGGGALHQARHGDGEGVIVCVPVKVLEHLLPHILEVPAQEDGPGCTIQQRKARLYQALIAGTTHAMPTADPTLLAPLGWPLIVARSAVNDTLLVL
jgi:hypothetical protein